MITYWQKLLQEHGAVFTKTAANKVISFQSSLAEEAKLASTSSIVVPLAYSLLEVTGPDAAKFLQGQLSCDIDKITEQQRNLAAYCNVKGRILTLLKITKSTRGYLLSFPNCLEQDVIAELKKYGVFSKIEIKSLKDFVILGIAGENIKQELQKLSEWQQLQAWQIASGPAGLMTASLVTDEMTTARENLTINGLMSDNLKNPQLLEIYLKNDEAKSIWQSLISQHNFAPCGTNAWELLAIQAGLPEIYQTSKEQILPHYINLPQLGAISFDKGCYRGQEIIARMQYRGTIKRHLYRYCSKDTIKNLPTPGDKVYLGAEQTAMQDAPLKAIGTFIRTAVDQDGKLQALVELADENVHSITEPKITLLSTLSPPPLKKM